MFVALLVAVGVTALVAVVMMLVTLQRSARLTVVRGLASAAMGVGIVAAAAVGVVAVSAPAEAATPHGPVVTDLQLPTR
jgi:predicted MFS family arabinose efflux permease